MARSRDEDASRKREQRDNDRVVVIPRVVDMERRQILELDDVDWLRWYFGDGCGDGIEAFTYEFTAQQRFMIQAISRAIDTTSEYGDQSIAASRGEGKSMIARRTLLKYVLSGALNVSVLVGATATDAAGNLESLQAEILQNDRLAEDYPEVVYPVRAVEGSPQKAASMLVSGVNEKTGQPFEKVLARFKWSGDKITFPTVPGSVSADFCIVTRGLESAVRGLNYKGRRPGLVLIDDPDTEDTAEKEPAAEKLEKRIDGALGGLGKQTRRVRRVMLTSIQSRVSVSARYTDPKLKPSWHGVRFRFLVKPPTNRELWDRYIQMYSDDFRLGTKHAVEFYRENFAAMNLGHEVSNPNRHEPGELSALQHYYNLVAVLGQARVSAEYDNDPIDDAGADGEKMEWQRICKRLSGYARGIVPAGHFVTMGVDIGKWRIHCSAKAWRMDGRDPMTVDYCEIKTRGASRGTDEGLDDAITAALDELRETYADGFETDAGTWIQPRRVYVDTRYRADAIVAWCLRHPGWHPIAGHGHSEGTVSRSFTDAVRRSRDRRQSCTGVVEIRKQHNGELYWHTAIDADHWKRWSHDRWSTPVVRDGQHEPRAMRIFGVDGDSTTDRLVGDELEHREFAKHICAEHEVGGKWKCTGDNHYLDTDAYAAAAAAREGVPMTGVVEVPTETVAKKPRKRVSYLMES